MSVPTVAVGIDTSRTVMPRISSTNATPRRVGWRRGGCARTENAHNASTSATTSALADAMIFDKDWAVVRVGGISSEYDNDRKQAETSGCATTPQARNERLGSLVSDGAQRRSAATYAMSTRQAKEARSKHGARERRERRRRRRREQSDEHSETTHDDAAAQRRETARGKILGFRCGFLRLACVKVDTIEVGNNGVVSFGAFSSLSSFGTLSLWRLLRRSPARHLRHLLACLLVLGLYSCDPPGALLVIRLFGAVGRVGGVGSGGIGENMSDDLVDKAEREATFKKLCAKLENKVMIAWSSSSGSVRALSLSCDAHSNGHFVYFVCVGML